MSKISSHQRFSEVKTKQLFKIALEKHPKSINSLKQSLVINRLKNQNFINCINNSTDIFHTSYTYNRDQKEEAQLISDYEKPFKKGRERKFFKQLKSKEYKDIGKKMLLLRKTSTDFHYQNGSRPTSQYLKIKRPISIDQTKNPFEQYFKAQTSKVQKFLSETKRQTHEKSNSSHNRFQANQKFWKKIGNGQSRTSYRRTKTQADEKIGVNTLADLTKYSIKKQNKAANFLILQLQINVDDTKRTRRIAGLPQ